MPFRPTREQLEAARGKGVRDVVGPDLDVLFCGINPGLYTAAIGHHFGRPGNRFWKVLHLAGFTPRELSPFEERELLRYGCGVTNLVNVATARADELDDADLVRGAARLTRAVRRWRPKAVAILGMDAYRTAFARRRTAVGPQEARIADAAVWVLPNTSGLQASYQLADLVRLFGALRAATRR
ncbi:MAG TPA: G/U mismatch-specific DNA glycosylase [Candidatus Limnocylindria bacterium]|nr:G/U mismatch-specific DNA glycosylase [Candidatus Limnocylindria bacterium]